MNCYLITGGAGFIGANFIQYMFSKYPEQVQIINLDKLTYAGNLLNLKEVKNRVNYTFIKGDICDKALLEKIFKEYKVDCVVNFAAESHVDRSITNPEIFAQTNILGTQVLLNVARHYWQTADGFRPGNKFLQVSTDEVYGSLGSTGYFTEDTPLNPTNPYSASKAAADLLVKAHYDTYRLPTNITRCSNNYGPYQFPEKLIPLMITNCLQNKPLPVYGDGKNVRDWIYVIDHCRAIDVVIHSGVPGEVYNIGGGNEKQNISIVQLIIETIRKLLPNDDPRKQNITENLIRYVEDRKGHDNRYAIDAQKLSTSLNWFPETPFETGIAYTIKWYLSNQDWLAAIASGDYLHLGKERFDDEGDYPGRR